LVLVLVLVNELLLFVIGNFCFLFKLKSLLVKRFSYYYYYYH